MANSGGPTFYSPLSKPPPPHARRPKLLSFAVLVVLCSISYLFGVWQRGGGGGADGVAVGMGNLNAGISCPTSNLTTTVSAAVVPGNRKLDFGTHHSGEDSAGINASSAAVRPFPLCDVKYSEYTPCEDPVRSLKFDRDRLIYRERHCPEKNELLKCRIPAPYGYRNPFRWPASRDLAWYANVPHKELTVEKAVQNWIRFEGDRFRFPGGGTMFPNGAGAYIDDIGKLINLKDGSIRTAIDTGCGVASWGAYLLSRNIVAMSFAPRDTHEAQVQFALERGVPAMIGVIASKRLPYPSRAFDMAHCSRCLIPWGQQDGQYLIEVDRLLRPGGYWILSGPPINWRKHWKGWQRTQEDLNSEQQQIENVAKSLCWKKLIERDDIAIWQKPTNHIFCKKLKKVHKSPPLCPLRNPDKAWYTNLETCVTPLPDVSSNEEVSGGSLEKWPGRLTAVPPRISRGTVDGITPEVFRQDMELWKKRVTYYTSINNELGTSGRYRNILDMNAYMGGFAANLFDDSGSSSSWVMNIVPVEAKVDTLGIVYERGLIGTYHTWCEAMSTYPRTYDFVHADLVFTMYKDRCQMEDIMLEMDRILRPEGGLIIRDDVDVLLKAKAIAEALNWDSKIVDHEDGPMEREKLLFAVKLYSTAPKTS
ncbi:probable methyltransferase PMT16 [Andrographis paniculata]|uniref:probable methyltransferase PMT16 n=1 Tax=Andrographis paniculata TaxID=175694 RepID=UPI0021E936AD|nr:probable methyltransferase PMT16 [Andrographis paniculata]